MSMVLKPYPEYKDSGLPWLRKIPVMWGVRRNGRLFAERKQSGFPDLPILEVSLKTGVRIRNFDASKRKQVMADRAKYKRACKEDIAYNMMRLWQGAVGVPPVDGLISPSYVVARPYTDVNSRFYAYLFRTDAYMHEVNQYSHGIVADRNRLYWDEFKQMPSVYAPFDEQCAIVKFLDAYARLVQWLIRAKQQLIELLNEQKHAIIQQAVTRGLDPNVRLKSSGIDWVGDVPEHWEVQRLKFMARVIYGISPHQSTYNTDGHGAILVNGPDEYSVEDFGQTRAIKWTTSPVKFAPIGSLLFCLRGSTTGRLNLCHNDVSIGRGVAAIVPHEDVQFLTLVMMTLRGFLKATFRGSTFPSVTSAQLNNYRLPKPPLNEQRAIAVAVAGETAHVDSVMERARREIDLLREYRTRLLADVVTGKRDVRGVELPALDEAEALEDWETEEDAQADEVEEMEDVDA